MGTIRAPPALPTGVPLNAKPPARTAPSTPPRSLRLPGHIKTCYARLLTQRKACPTAAQNGGSACVLLDSACYAAPRCRPASPRGWPSIQHRLDWSAGDPWPLGQVHVGTVPSGGTGASCRSWRRYMWFTALGTRMTLWATSQRGGELVRSAAGNTPAQVVMAPGGPACSRIVSIRAMTDVRDDDGVSVLSDLVAVCPGGLPPRGGPLMRSGDPSHIPVRAPVVPGSGSRVSDQSSKKAV
jgi:hypothetical protein